MEYKGNQNGKRQGEQAMPTIVHPDLTVKVLPASLLSRKIHKCQVQKMQGGLETVPALAHNQNYAGSSPAPAPITRRLS
jgi:hypothetical protein